MSQKLRIGIVGGGLGGLTAAIAIFRAEAEVTVLETAAHIGEVGAGIQMLPNASRFLIRWGVDKIISDNLVQHRRCNTYTGSSLVSMQDSLEMVKSTGYPWYVVRRDPLLDGWAESARLHGAELKFDSRVRSIEESTNSFAIETVHGQILG